MIRFVYVIWVFVFIALAMAAIADTIFGDAPLDKRLGDFLPRVTTALLWPFALLTPRGRYLLWRRWRS